MLGKPHRSNHVTMLQKCELHTYLCSL